MNDHRMFLLLSFPSMSREIYACELISLSSFMSFHPSVFQNVTSGKTCMFLFMLLYQRSNDIQISISVYLYFAVLPPYETLCCLPLDIASLNQVVFCDFCFIYGNELLFPLFWETRIYQFTHLHVDGYVVHIIIRISYKYTSWYSLFLLKNFLIIFVCQVLIFIWIFLLKHSNILLRYCWLLYRCI